MAGKYRKVLFSQLEPLPKLEQRQLGLLRKFLNGFEKIGVAYSGGVDSTLVATIAKEQLDNNAIAITGLSPALDPQLLNEARQQAAWIGIKHKECKTQELDEPSYRNNPQNRCYYCKKELHLQISGVFKSTPGIQIVDGVNHDDLGDYRPGLNAAKEAGVLSPLAELKIGKSSVRQISRALGLPWWDKPAQPCLASRFPYGEKLSLSKLQKVSAAEGWLREHGFNQVRVRSQGLSARIEVPEDQIKKLVLEIDRKNLINYFLAIGFTSVSVDLEGLLSGKLNRNLNKQINS